MSANLHAIKLSIIIMHYDHIDTDCMQTVATHCCNLRKCTFLLSKNLFETITYYQLRTKMGFTAAPKLNLGPHNDLAPCKDNCSLDER